MNNNKLPIFRHLPGLIVGAVIALFLSGRINEYPKGTREGGIIGAVGVAIILIASFIIFVFARYMQKKEDANNPLE